MAKIKNMTELREHLLEALDKLASHDIDIAEAAMTAKICDSAINSVKSQLEYFKMTNQEPVLPFMRSPNGEEFKGRTLEATTMPKAKLVTHKR